MEERVKKILNSVKSQRSDDKNESVNLTLNSKTKTVDENVVTKILSTTLQFEEERNSSSIYRIYGNIKSIVSNVLFNDNLKIYRKDGKTNSVYTSKNDITEKDGWVGYIDNDSITAQSYSESNKDFRDNKSSLCQLIPFDPGYDRLKFDDPDGKPNYMVKVTYPYDTEDITLIENDSGITLSDGIPFISIQEKLIQTISYTVFNTPINHGLKEGDIIKLFGIGERSDESFIVTQVGNENNINKNRSFVVDIEFGDVQFNKGVSRFAREVDGVLSQYYVRKYKTLTDGFKDYDRYPAAFAQSYFGDEEVGFNFTKDIDVSGKVDNLGRPLSELFLSIIKVDTDSL